MSGADRQQDALDEAGVAREEIADAARPYRAEPLPLLLARLAGDRVTVALHRIADAIEDAAYVIERWTR